MHRARTFLQRWSILMVASAAVPAITCGALAQAGQTSPASQPGDPTLQERLMRISDQLEKQRLSFHIPGMAIAIVKDDQVILSRGFGKRDLDNDMPATDDTLFAIGSTTKAFTATLIGMLIDEGKMHWDDKVRTYLPEFHLKDPTANEQITIRDLLCHRSGLARTDLLWFTGKVSRDEILQTIANAELFSPFREKFNYNNVMVMAAGQAAAQAAGNNATWEELIAQRIFKPLEMNSSNMTFEQAQANPMLSKGYLWDEDESKYKLLPMRNLVSIAPAGAINSNVKDMSQWLRFLVGKGVYNKKRLVSEDRLNETWTKQIDMTAGVGYGLCWMLRQWNNHRVIEHGGNIDGFAAEVALLPDDHVGFVLLTNVSASPLQSLSIQTVFDGLLGKWSPDLPSIDAAEVQPYLGKFYLDVLKANVTVLIQDGRLAVDVPGQMVFALKPPDDEGKWFFDFPQPIAVSFEKDEHNQVHVMKLYQSGLTFELPREGYTPPVEVHAQEVQKYLGVYHFEAGRRNEDWTVQIHNGRLAIDVPKQLVYDLKGPDDKGIWTFRASDSMSLKFNSDDSGAVTGMTFYQNGVATNLPRMHDAVVAHLPSVQEILALHSKAYGSDQLASLRSVRLSGPIKLLSQGITGVMTVTATDSKHFLQTLDLGKFGYINAAINGDSGWNDSTFKPYEELHGQSLNQLQLQNLFTLVSNWPDLFHDISVNKSESYNGHDDWSVLLTFDDDVRCTMLVDAQTGLVDKQTFNMTAKGLGDFTTSVSFGDYRDVNGVKLPFHLETENDIIGKSDIHFDKVETNFDLPATFFEHDIQPPHKTR